MVAANTMYIQEDIKEQSYGPDKIDETLLSDDCHDHPVLENNACLIVCVEYLV